ncbi:MAG TPA: serine/threonine-protein kinase [Kofleriaceae bacterium]|jgi:serine/threonine-protein kinase|nr:serine/threonine-protein kinase [Kofleriaceae bacterium]
MRSSADALADSATHGTTVVDPGIPSSSPEPIAPWNDATFRDLESESRQRPMDLRLRMRLWWLSSMTVLLSVAAMASTLVMGGSALVQRVFIAGMAATAAAGVWMGWMARTKRMTVKKTTIAWFIVGVGACCTMLYYGLFSAPGLMVAVFVVFFAGTRDERRVVVMVYALFAVFHVALVGVLARGAPELGTLPFSGGELGKLVVTELLIQLLLLATLIAACAIRRSMVGTVRDLEERARAIGHHELLLEDARRAFEASLRAAGGGRFSHQVLGSYRLGRLLGEGAMGEVYDAIDTRTGAPAAVKLLRRGVMENRRIVQRFLTEARIVTALHSDHVARVLETADPSASLPYIAMERLYGLDLRRYMRARRGGRMSPAEASDLLQQVAQGIDAAHGAGVVHRDLKPSNLFRADAGTWKVLDFGVSKVIGEHTAEHSVVGTPHFMSPEQLKGGTVDRRTDIFALGGIIYYVLTGKRAFDGDNLAAVALQVAHHVPPRPSELVPGIPPGVDEAVMTALAKDPGQRFATAAAFAEAFHAAVERELADADRDRMVTEPAIPRERLAVVDAPAGSPADGPERELGSLDSIADPEALGAAPLCTMLLGELQPQADLVLPSEAAQGDVLEPSGEGSVTSP